MMWKKKILVSIFKSEFDRYMLVFAPHQFTSENSFLHDENLLSSSKI